MRILEMMKKKKGGGGGGGDEEFEGSSTCTLACNERHNYFHA